MNDEGCAVASSAAQKTGMKTEKTQMRRCLQNDGRCAAPSIGDLVVVVVAVVVVVVVAAAGDNIDVASAECRVSAFAFALDQHSFGDTEWKRYYRNCFVDKMKLGHVFLVWCYRNLQ